MGEHQPRPRAGTAARGASTGRKSPGTRRRSPPYSGIADDRMADRAQVHANLMRAAGGDRHVDQRDARHAAAPR